MTPSKIVHKIFAQRMFKSHSLTTTDPEYHIMESTKYLFLTWKHISPLLEPHYIRGSHALTHNREKVLAKNLNKLVSDLWRTNLLAEFQDPPKTRQDAFILIAGQDLYRTDLFKPAPYITMDSNISTKALLCLHTQHTDEIPTHKHLYYDKVTGKSEKTNYGDRKCPACADHSSYLNQPLPPACSETHLLLNCPLTPIAILAPFVYNMRKQTMTLRIPKWDTLSPNQQISLALGSTPPLCFKLTNQKIKILRYGTINHVALLASRLSQYAPYCIPSVVPIASKASF